MECTPITIMPNDIENNGIENTDVGGGDLYRSYS